MNAWGLDGCRGGWFFFGIGENNIKFGVVDALAELLESISDDAQVLVDIPIGLPDARNVERVCDALARDALRPDRSSSVFPVPARSAVYASTYEMAAQLNRTALGKGLAKQSWALCPKIREVDSLLQESPNLRGRVREVHPEVCFWGIAGEPMSHSKKTREGMRERLEALTEVWHPARDAVAEAFLKYGGFEAERDDIIDALVATVCAREIENCSTLPGEPETDSAGLTMEMVYLPVRASL